MKLKTRFTLIVFLLLAFSIISIAISLFFNTRQALLDQALNDGEILASVIARTSGMAKSVEHQTELQLNQDMLTSARILSHFVQVAEKAKLSPKQINRHLQAIVGPDNLGEIWITDPKGTAYLHSKPGASFQFLSDAIKQPQASEFWMLLSSNSDVVIQPVLKRESDGEDYKYVGISGIDKPRIIQVGINPSVINTLKRMLGTQELINRVVEKKQVEKIWIVNKELSIIHFAAVEQDYSELSDLDKDRLNQSIQGGKLISNIDGDNISIAAPIFETITNSVETKAHFIGAILLHISTNSLFLSILQQMIVSALFVILILTMSLVLLGYFTKSITDPLLAISDAALALQRGHLKTLLLESVSKRKDELGVLARVFQEMAHKVLDQKLELENTVTERTLDLKHKNNLLEAAQKRIEDELQVAHSLQQAILPHSFPQQAEFTAKAVMLPAQQLAGDFYDFIELGDGKIGILIADVADKGVASAFFMAYCSTVIRLFAETFASPAQVLAEANQRILANNPKELFVTVFYAVLDTLTGQFIYSNAGHLAPFMFSADKQPKKLSRTQGMALGVLDNIEFSECSFEFEPGDCLFMYSDGITEAFNQQDQQFGDANLIKCLIAVAEQEPEQMIKHLVNAVKDFEGTAPQSDDLTAIALLRIKK